MRSNNSASHASTPIYHHLTVNSAIAALQAELGKPDDSTPLTFADFMGLCQESGVADYFAPF
jgi:hypothetical protein